MNPRPIVSIVIPTLGHVDLTRTCLGAIAATTAEVAHEVIVVDNASGDGTREFLRAEDAAGRLRAVLNDENVGFGRACNQGAAIARGDYLLLLNNDTIPLPGWLGAMVALAEADSSVGVVGSRLLYPDETVQHAGVAFLQGGVPVHAHRGVARDAPEVLTTCDSPAVTGACLLIPADLFAEIGGFDDAYYFYVEDLELCMRVWEAGRRVVYCAESVVHHLENASVSDTRWRDEKVLAGLQLLRTRWAGRWPAPVRRLTWPVELPGGPRHFAVLAFADELLADIDLLAAYCAEMGDRDDATLVVAVPTTDPGAADRLSGALTTAGLNDTGADLLALPVEPGAENGLVGCIDAVLSQREVAGALGARPRFDSASVAELAAVARRRLPRAA